MKWPIPFLIGLGGTLLLLFAQAWSPNMLGDAWLATVAVLVLGGFAWLILSLVSDTLGQFRTTRAKLGGAAALLLLFALTAVLSVGYASAILAMIGLFGCLLWQGIRDYAQIFQSRPKVAGPGDWTALEHGQLPRSEKATRERVKAKFSHSYEIRGRCVARVGRYGLISHPLKMDE